MSFVSPFETTSDPFYKDKDILQWHQTEKHETFRQHQFYIVKDAVVTKMNCFRLFSSVAHTVT